ncbi:hypothetical protein LOAG_08686 [Loa loa]|uniref:DB domain-containing protein n=1 Tax=Loa loa TaxID=7209 RepID=A0A1S0TT68_LOALO|nr:hypothetical protein LOAG_08686 [Loa loa]EFO19809.1 hypothetical protein LOAG_08686 [Loa loa]
MAAASAVVSAKERLPPCELIPKLLCCTERILDKCLIHCLNYISAKCLHKMQNYYKIITSMIGSYQKTGSNFYNQQVTCISTAVLTTTLPEPITQNVRRQLIKKPMVFVESNESSKKSFEFPNAPNYQTDGDYICLNRRYPNTEVSDSNLPSNSAVKISQPSYSPYLSRKLIDEVFLICCQHHVPSNCYNLCTYEHREHIAMETLIQANKQNACDLKYLNNIVYCANQNRNNQKLLPISWDDIIEITN